MKINDIEFELTGDIYEIKGRGKVYAAKLSKNDNYTFDSVGDALVGELFNDKPIKGVEMFAAECQSSRQIGILIENES